MTFTQRDVGTNVPQVSPNSAAASSFGPGATSAVKIATVNNSFQYIYNNQTSQNNEDKVLPHPPRQIWSMEHTRDCYFKIYEDGTRIDAIETVLQKLKERNVQFVVGDPGVGKSVLASVIHNKYVQDGKFCIFHSFTDNTANPSYHASPSRFEIFLGNVCAQLCDKLKDPFSSHAYSLLCEKRSISADKFQQNEASRICDNQLLRNEISSLLNAYLLEPAFCHQATCEAPVPPILVIADAVDACDHRELFGEHLKKWASEKLLPTWLTFLVTTRNGIFPDVTPNSMDVVMLGTGDASITGDIRKCVKKCLTKYSDKIKELNEDATLNYLTEKLTKHANGFFQYVEFLDAQLNEMTNSHNVMVVSDDILNGIPKQMRKKYSKEFLQLREKLGEEDCLKAVGAVVATQTPLPISSWRRMMAVDKCDKAFQDLKRKLNGLLVFAEGNVQLVHISMRHWLSREYPQHHVSQPQGLAAALGSWFKVKFESVLQQTNCITWCKLFMVLGIGIHVGSSGLDLFVNRRCIQDTIESASSFACRIQSTLSWRMNTHERV